MSDNLKLLNKIVRIYADRLGRERGAMSAFARDIEVDPRLVAWWRSHDKPIPAHLAEATEKATKGKVPSVDVVMNEIRHRKEQRAAKLGKTYT